MTGHLEKVHEHDAISTFDIELTIENGLLLSWILEVGNQRFVCERLGNRCLSGVVNALKYNHPAAQNSLLASFLSIFWRAAANSSSGLSKYIADISSK